MQKQQMESRCSNTYGGTEVSCRGQSRVVTELRRMTNSYNRPTKIGSEQESEQPLISWGILILGNSGYPQWGAREGEDHTAGVARLPRVPGVQEHRSALEL